MNVDRCAPEPPMSALATHACNLNAQCPIQSSEAAPADLGRAYARRRLKLRAPFKCERASMGRWSVTVLIQRMLHADNVDDPFYVRPAVISFFYMQISTRESPGLFSCTMSPRPPSILL